MNNTSSITASLVLAAAFSAAAAVEVLPSDRFAMADRLFNRGDYAAAASEYRALRGEKSIAADALLYRLAECERATGNAAGARQLYAELVAKFPESKHAPQARLMTALDLKGEERAKALAALDSDRVPDAVRAAALYHYGADKGDADALERCVKLAPDGRYAAYAKLRRGVILSSSPDAVRRRTGVGVLLDLAFGGGTLADEALYLAASVSYREKKYGEAGSLFRRYRRLFPKGSHFQETMSMSLWCDYMTGRNSDVIAACGDATTEDTCYLKAAATHAAGDTAAALPLFRKYLDGYPQGRYRKEAELALSRIEFDAAAKDSDRNRAVEAAKRAYKQSGLAGDGLRLAWAYELAGRNAEADEAYLKVIKSAPGGAEAAQALYSRSMLAARSGEWAKAELALAEAIAGGKLVAERLSSAWYWRGVAAMKLGHEKEGYGFLTKAVELGLGLDESREARLMLADCDYRNGRLDVAKKAYVQLVSEGACERMSVAHIHAVGKFAGGETAAICAKELLKQESPEWRQCGWAMFGAYEEEKGAFTTAIDAYRKALAEKTRTAEAAGVALALGNLEFRAGEHGPAEKSLKEAVKLNAKDPRGRAKAYVMLAENALAAGDEESAKGYATVVVTLFDDPEFTGAARKILEKAGEGETK